MRHASLCSLLLVPLVAACGGSSPAAAPDAPDLGPGGAVRLTVTQAGQPVRALTVYFVDADGTLVATASTDAAGQASATLHTGGSVTVVTPPLASSTEARDLESWVDVQPGDDLALDLPVDGTGGTISVSAPASTIAGVASYRIVTPCSGSAFLHAGVEAVLGWSPTCTRDPHASDFAVFAQDASEHDIAGFVAPHLGISNGQHLALTGTYQPLVDVPISYANVPSADGIAVTAYALASTGLTPVADTALAAASGSATGTFHWPAQLTTGTRVIATYANTDGDSLLSWAPVAASVSLDLANQLGQAITSQALVDAAHQQISWTLADHGAPAQLAVASLAIDQASGARIVWTLAAPGLRQQIALPQLPGAIVDIPSPQTTGVSLVLLRVPGGTAAWTKILGKGGFFDRFTGVMAATPSGTIGQVVPPGVPL